MESNIGSLLSTHQAREAGVWLCDKLIRHGGSQRLIAPIEHSEKFFDLNLIVKDGLLAIKCEYPSEKDLEELPRVWLTSNEFPWTPEVFQGNDSSRVVTCWDGTSEIQTLNRMTHQPVDMRTNIEGVNMGCNDYLKCTLNYLNKSHTTDSNSSTNETSKVISVQSHIKEENYEALRQFLRWLPEETVRKTFGCNTQLALSLMLIQVVR